MSDVLKDLWLFLKVRKKFWLAPLIVTDRLAGENVHPLLAGVTVYVPFARPVSV